VSRRHALLAASWSVAAVAGACSYDGRSLDLFPTGELSSEIARCSGAADCPTDRPFCSGGLCVECLSDAECRGNKPACLAGVCVTCSGPEHCPAGSACNVAAERCAPACRSAEDCSGAQGLCDMTQGFCVECLEGSDCNAPDRAACERPAGQCVACNSDGDCSGMRPACDTIRHQCVECTSAEHCAGLICDSERQRCAQCSRDADCASGTRCDPMGRCQEDCSANAADAAVCRPAPPP
jgi:Cys-rich repeat protein